MVPANSEAYCPIPGNKTPPVVNRTAGLRDSWKAG